MRAGSLSEEEIRALLRHGVDPSLRYELECELSWRAHSGRRGSNPARTPEFIPGWILAATVRERRR